MSPQFTYSDLLPLGEDSTKYRLLTKDGVSVKKHGDLEFLHVEPSALTALSEVAIHDISHYLRAAHLQQLANILSDPEASPNDRFVATDLLKNANIAAGGILPMCQDTGTALIMGKKGQHVLTSGKDEVAPDQTTFDFVMGRPGAPTGDDWKKMVETWKTLHTDEGADFDTEHIVDVSQISPQVTWGTNPEMVIGVGDSVPEPKSDGDHRALEYMGLEAGTPIEEISLDRVFIGSCTNSRIGDLRAAAEVIKGRKVADSVYAMVVPGSVQVKKQAEDEGLDKLFSEAGFDWRGAGCSMCLGMNPDTLQPEERCASTSNRNFEGRQGRGGRTHLVSPQMAAAAAIEGRFVDIRTWGEG